MPMWLDTFAYNESMQQKMQHICVLHCLLTMSNNQQRRKIGKTILKNQTNPYCTKTDIKVEHQTSLYIEILLPLLILCILKHLPFASGYSDCICLESPARFQIRAFLQKLPNKSQVSIRYMYGFAVETNPRHATLHRSLQRNRQKTNPNDSAANIFVNL